MPTEITTTAQVTWETLRQSLGTVQILGKRYLLGKAFLGWQLSVLKAQHHASGGGRGGDRKSMGEIRPLITWAELVTKEAGLQKRTADELIRLWEAALARHKRLRGPAENRKLLSYLDTTDALTIQGGEEAAEFADHFSYILDGETAANLMQELGVIPKPLPMPEKKGGKKDKDTDITAGQLAFHFFDGLGASLINTRMNPQYLKLLHALPIQSTEEHPLSLTTLETEARALLADIEKIKSAAAKPARRIG
jgi:hypothetical protein